EDGIRAFHVTGVQTCALPISERALGDLLLGQRVGARRLPPPRAAHEEAFAELRSAGPEPVPAGELRPGDLILLRAEDVVPADARSEERRVGKECTARRATGRA